MTHQHAKGNFIFRGSPELHAALRSKAKEEQVSLNLLVVSELSKAIGEAEAIDKSKRDIGGKTGNGTQEN